jgi:hypothetical protein
MADIVLQRNVGALGSLVALSTAALVAAGGASNSATTTGIVIDRQGFGSGSLADSTEIAVLFAATLQSGKTLSLGYDLQEGPDGVNFSDYKTATYAVVATGPAGGGAVSGQLQIGASLRSARRYVRLNFATNLSATATDTATAQAAGFFAGFDRLPQGPG